MANKRTKRRGRIWRWALAILVVLLMGLIVVAAAGYRLTTQIPAWWALIDPNDEHVSTQAAQIENLLTSEFSRADRAQAPPATNEDGHWQSEPWEIRLSAADANAWLNTRLPRWAENRLEDFQWPPELRSIQVAFDHGRVRLGASVKLDSRDRVFSAELTPRVEPDGKVWLDMGWMYLGRLPIPAGWLLDSGRFIPDSFDDEPGFHNVARALAGDIPIMHEPIIALGDGRRVRILSMELHEGELVLTCQTEHGGDD